VGLWDGGSIAIDEYGRNPSKSTATVQRQRNREFETFQAGREEWSKKRLGKSISTIADMMRQDSADRSMNNYLHNEG